MLYNFAVAIDDLDAGITHVVRGEDHLSNTPKQLLVLEAVRAVGFGPDRPPPVYAHLPLLHGPDGKKLSKRHGAASVQELRDAGYLPEAVRNYLALLGWGAGDDQTVLSTEELIERFALERVSPQPGALRRDQAALAERRLDPQPARAELTRRIGSVPARKRPRGRRRGRGSTRVEISQEKIHTLADFWPLTGPLLDGPVDDPKARERWLGEEGRGALRRVARGAGRARGLRRGRRRPALEAVRRAREVKPREVYQPLRVAIAGHDRLTRHLRERRAARPRGDAAPDRPDLVRRRLATHCRRIRTARARKSRPRGRVKFLSTIRPGLPIGTSTMPATATKTKSGARKTASAGARRERGALKVVAPAPNGSGGTPAPAPNGTSGTSAPARSTRRQGEGHGRRLTSAFEALEAFPALAESRNRLLAVVEKDNVATADIVTAVESDVALSIAVLRLANQVQGRRGRVETIVAAVEALSEQTVQALAARVRTFDFFERSSVWDAAPERFRLHALSTQHAADRLAAEVGYEHRDRLTVTSLLHDVGKLVLLHAYPGYPAQVHRGARTPEERIHQERRELGVDHALVGGVLIRRWGLPSNVATAIERHHNPDVEGEVAFVRLADMLAHYEQGSVVSPGEMLQTARVLGLGAGRAQARDVRAAEHHRPAPAPRRPLAAVRTRARRAATPRRRQGLQADRPRADALHEHRAHAPAQHLRQARRGRSRAGGV